MYAIIILRVGSLIWSIVLRWCNGQQVSRAHSSRQPINTFPQVINFSGNSSTNDKWYEYQKLRGHSRTTCWIMPRDQRGIQIKLLVGNSFLSNDIFQRSYYEEITNNFFMYTLLVQRVRFLSRLESETYRTSTENEFNSLRCESIGFWNVFYFIFILVCNPLHS